MELCTAKQTVSSFALQKLSSSFLQCAVHINTGLTGLNTIEWATSLVAAWQCSFEQALLQPVHPVEYGVTEEDAIDLIGPYVCG